MSSEQLLGRLSARGLAHDGMSGTSEVSAKMEKKIRKVMMFERPRSKIVINAPAEGFGDKEAIQGPPGGPTEAKVMKVLIEAASRLDGVNSDQFGIWLDPGEATEAELAELFAALSELNRTEGGSGLLFDRVEAGKPLLLDPV